MEKIVFGLQLFANIDSTAENTSVNGTSGNDTITNYGNKVSINAGAGDDSIIQMKGYVTIYGGDGDDKITMRGGALNKVYGDAGNDYIYDNYSNTFNTIYGGDGDDTVFSYTGNVHGGAGSDMITISGPATASGGTGNDTIYGVDEIGIFDASRNTRLYKYTDGDGDDVIFGFKAIDKLKIVGDKYSTVKSGSDLIVNVGSGSVTLKNAATLAVNIVWKKMSDVNVSVNGRYSNSNPEVFLKGSNNNDTIDNYAKDVTIDSGEGNDYIRNSYSNDGHISINSGDGNDTIYNGTYGPSNTIDAGAGDDFVYDGYMNVAGTRVSLGAGNDTLYSWTYNGFINGGIGNDLIRMDNEHVRNVIEYKVGDGDDTIYGFNPTDTIKLVDGSVASSSIVGDNVVLKVGTGSITLVNARSVNVDGTVINPSAKNGTNDHDFITNFSSNVTLNGYGDDDKIANSGDKVLINTGDGNNSIGNYGNNVSIKTGNGNNTILSGVYMHANITAGSGNDSIHTGWASSTINAGAGNDTVVVHYATYYNKVKIRY